VKLSLRIRLTIAGAAVLAISQVFAAPPPTPNGGGAPFWSPDGRTLAFASATPNSPVDLWVVAPSAGAPVPQQLTREGARFLAWAPDGRSVYCQTLRRGHASYYALDVDSGLERPILSFLGDDTTTVSLSPDGKQVAYVRITAGHHNLWLAAFDGSGAQQLTTGLPVRSVAWEADGKRLAFDAGGDYGESLFVLTLPAGKPLLVFGDLCSYPSWSPDGKRLVALGMHVINVIAPDGSANRRLHVSQADRSPLSWSPDGKRLVYIAVDKGAFDVAAVDVETGASVPLAAGWAEASAPQCSPDGRSVAFEARRKGDPAGNLYVVGADGKGLLQLTHSFPSQWAGRHSGDGKQLYFQSNATDAGTPALFRADPRGGPSVRLLPINPRLDTQFSWPRQSPTGVFVNGGTIWQLSPTAAAKQLLQTDYPTSADLSPTGAQLVYVKWKERAPSLVVRQLADSSEKQLLSPPAAGLAYSKLAWSPAGQEIAFVRGNSLCKMKLTDTSATVLWEPGPEAGGGVLLSPVWSPDGRRLVFGRFFVETAAQRLEIRVVNADGSQPAVVDSSEIVAERGWYADPLSLPYAWSPDSQRLVCGGEMTGAPALFQVTLPSQASPPVLVQRAAAYPEWLADGQTLAYTSLADNREKLAETRVPANGGGQP
jgi:TolB protein